MIQYGIECKLCKATSPMNLNNTVDTSHILLKGKRLIIYNFIVVIVLIPWSFPKSQRETRQFKLLKYDNREGNFI